jgi:hypothetical protein
MREIWQAVIAITAAVLTGACTIGGGGPMEGLPSTAPTLPAVPTGPPPMPEPAAAVRETVRTFYEQVDDALATGNVSYLRLLATPGCTECKAFADEVVRVFGRVGAIRTAHTAGVLEATFPQPDLARAVVRLDRRGGATAESRYSTLAAVSRPGSAEAVMTFAADELGAWRVEHVVFRRA